MINTLTGGQRWAEISIYQSKLPNFSSILRQRSQSINVTVVSALTHSLSHTHTVNTLWPQMWKQLGRVFVVGRELSCPCTRQLMMGNMKPGWAKPPDLSFGPDRLSLGQTWLCVRWCIDKWDLFDRIMQKGDKGLDLVRCWNKMVVI